MIMEVKKIYLNEVIVQMFEDLVNEHKRKIFYSLKKEEKNVL